MLLDAIKHHALTRPSRAALCGGDVKLSYAELAREVQLNADRLPGERIGLLMGNHPAWAVADLAVLQAGKVCVPLPPFFSDEQLGHTLRDAAIETLLTDQPQRFRDCPVRHRTTMTIAGRSVSVLRLQDTTPPRLAAGVCKITYTSGTTGQPKGVCLQWPAIQTVIESLLAVSQAHAADQALALLPLSTLLENIGSVYVPLQLGATALLPGATETGITGSSQLAVPTLLACLNHYRPSGLILIPQLLQALVEAAEQGAPLPDSLRFLAVGGAPVARELLERARHQRLPVYQGYGLSEAASVVTLNNAAHDRPGSVGRALPHASLRIAEDGEVHVRGALFCGYLGQAPQAQPTEWATGDLGYLDEDGFLHLTGRKKNVFITSFGRNVAPDWVECELQAGTAIAQAAVFGEARPFNVALLVPRAGADEAAVRTAVEVVNARLPDYARIGKYLLASAPFSVANGMLTGTGRIRRDRIAAHYRAALVDLYEEVA